MRRPGHQPPGARTPPEERDGTALPAPVGIVDLVDRKPPVWRLYLRALGPGLITGASDDDPSGIATYAQSGARFG